MSKKLAMMSAALLAFSSFAYAQTQNAEDQDGRGVIGEDTGTQDATLDNDSLGSVDQDAGSEDAALDSDNTVDSQDNNIDATGVAESKQSKTPGDVGEMAIDEGAIDEGAIAPAAGTTVNDDSAFVSQVSSSNAFEIASSELALQRAEDPEVRSFAEDMVEDHQLAAEQLAAASDSVDATVTMPTDVSEMDDRHQAMFEQLQEAEGSEFDDMYMDMQENAHMQAVDLFRNYQQTGEDDQLRRFAEDTLPTLEEHLNEVEMMDMQG